MKHSTSFKTKVLAIVLTIAALAAGQTASATTKTYTVSGGQGNSPTEFYALFSDGSSSTDQVSWTYNSTAEISFSLPGGLTLKLSNTAKQLLVRDNNSIGGRGATTLTVSSQTYYIYHVRLLDSSGNVIQLDANGSAVTQGGVSQCDYWNMTKSFSHTFSNGILFSKIEVSYATAIPITDAVITGLSSQYSVSNTAIMPTPTVTWHGTTLTLGTHCTISYLNNTAPGTATVKATGKGIFSSSTSVSANYILVWATYSVRFNKNNDAATGTMANQDFTYSTAQPLTANGFTTPTGYTFAGWNTAADGSGTSYTDRQEVQNLTATNGGTVDLYAQWTPITYTLRLHHNDGTGAYTDMAMTYDQPKNIQSISRTGYTFAGWNTAADGSGTAYTDGQSVQNLTATDGATVDLYAQWEVIPWSGTGSSETPYIISYPSQLDLLATRVNSGNSYYDKYFVLANDITYTHTTDWDNAASTENNYTPIGGYFNSSLSPFLGTFDGQGHTVSGIRIYKGGSDYHADSYLGLFGYIDRPGVVKNVTVSDMRITGYSYVGGIVGRNYDGGSVENCHATATVCLNAVQGGAYGFGGIVGSNHQSDISNCTSAVTITVADNLTGCQNFGGIVGDMGFKSSVSNCLAVGVAIPDISFKDYYQNDVTASGAIAGCFDVNSVLSNNYYTDCTLGGTPTASGIGVGYDYNNYARRDVTDNNGAVPAVVLQGRTLYKDGDWNTLCLPFDVEFAGSPLAGAEARTLSSASYADGTLTLNFSNPVQTLTAGTPYIIRWEKASDYVNDDEHNIVNPVFTNVTIDNTARNVETTNVSFVGTYNAMSFTEENRSILLVGAGNSLFYPLSGASLGAFRAYFQLNGITAGDVSGNVKMFFGEEENETSLSEELRVKSEESDNAVYDLSGRKINSQLPKGIYIKNGKKVLINK